MTSVDLEDVHSTLIEVARQAGKTILERSGKVQFDDKKNGVDLVTEVDKAVEQMVSTALRTKYPNYQFIGEETYVAGKTVLTNEPTFIVDPIDGTTNFIHFFPQSCISLGFAIDKKPVVGVIYNPFADLMYTGIKGRGSYLNNQRLPLRSNSNQPLTLQGSLCGIEWGADRSGTNYEIKTNTFKSLGAETKDGGAFVHGFRSMGSAAMNLGSVAAGQLDCYWEGGHWPWDICAGWVIVEEAGGMMVSGNPGNFEPGVESRVILAIRGAPKEDQKKFAEEFWKHIPGDMDYKL